MTQWLRRGTNLFLLFPYDHLTLMSSTIFVNYSPDGKVPDDEESADHVDSPVHQTETGRWEKYCPSCEEWIGIGPKGGEYSFMLHRRGNRCKRTEQRKVQEGVTEALEQSFGVHVAPTSPHVQAASSSTTEPQPPVSSHESTHVKPSSPYLPHHHPTGYTTTSTPLYRNTVQMGAWERVQDISLSISRNGFSHLVRWNRSTKP